MPFFSFALKDSSYQFKSQIIENKVTYYSKNLNLWNQLKSKNAKNIINFIRFEKREKINKLKKKILFCVPPKIGLGDAVEYGIAIQSIIKSNKFKKIGVAFSAEYSFFFKKKFKIKNIYPFIISKKDIESYDNVFHLTLEIEALKSQKYLRSDIVSEVLNYFKISNKKNEKIKSINKKKINKISIFPISTSPLRTMPVNILNELLLFLKNKIEVEIFFNDKSDISKFIEKNIIMNNFTKKDPKNLNSLIRSIEKIEFGIFVDSGPLHISKIIGKKGILVETSVSGNVLLKNYKQIKVVKNEFISTYCKAPCGLVDIFSFNKKIGCYSSLKVKQKKILNLENFNELQRREIKQNNIFYLLNPVGCVESININNIKKIIEREVF